MGPVLGWVQNHLSDRGGFLVLNEGVDQRLIDHCISRLGTLKEPIGDSLHSCFKLLRRVSVLLVSIFKQLVCNDVLIVLVGRGLDAWVDKVIQFGVKHASLCEVHTVKLLLHEDILGVILTVSLKVVTVLCLFFLHSTEEVCEVLYLSLSLAFEHTLLPALMVLWITKLSRIELLHFVENPVKLLDGQLDVVPRLVLVAADERWPGDGVLLHLLITDFIGVEHSVQFLVHFLETFKLVGWVNEDAVSFICIHLNVNVGRGYGLHLSLRAVTEHTCHVDLPVFLLDFKVSHLREHHLIVIILRRHLVL